MTSGLPAAASNVGATYMKGDGVPVDAVQAIQWFEKAADMGNAKAMNAIGAIVANVAKNVPADPVQATAWFLKAAKAGDAEGMKNFGLCCLRGIGIEQDRALGWQWMKRAAKGGNSDAAALLKLGSTRPSERGLISEQ